MHYLDPGGGTARDEEECCASAAAAEGSAVSRVFSAAAPGRKARLPFYTAMAFTDRDLGRAS
jgi:hypothetical protein